MKRTVTAIGLAAAMGFVAGQLEWGRGATAHAHQDADQSEGIAGELQSMIDMSQPGEAHERLDPLVGDWDVAVKIWFAPGETPMEATANVSREWIFGDRFIEERTNESNAAAEVAYAAVAYFGYNNFEGEYFSVSLDNMNTGFDDERGVYNESEKTLTLWGTHRDPMSGRTRRGWTVYDLSNPDRHVATAYMLSDAGEEYKGYEAIYERRQGG